MNRVSKAVQADPFAFPPSLWTYTCIETLVTMPTPRYNDIKAVNQDHIFGLLLSWKTEIIGMADGVLGRRNLQEQPSPGFVIEMKRELCRWSKVAFSKILRNNSKMVNPTNLFSQMCDHQHMCGIWGKSGQVSSSEADFTILSRHVSSSSSVWLNVEILITSVEPHRSAALL